jgi:26S proteasome regulatory subunit T6
MSLQRGINLRALAEKMGQCSGAEVRGICTEAGMWSHYLTCCVSVLIMEQGMYALRERRQHVTQEDFEFAVAKVLKKNQEGNTSVNKLFS